MTHVRNEMVLTPIKVSIIFFFIKYIKKGWNCSLKVQNILKWLNEQ